MANQDVIMTILMLYHLYAYSSAIQVYLQKVRRKKWLHSVAKHNVECVCAIYTVYMYMYWGDFIPPVHHVDKS